MPWTGSTAALASVFNGTRCGRGGAGNAFSTESAACAESWIEPIGSAAGSSSTGALGAWIVSACCNSECGVVCRAATGLSWVWDGSLVRADCGGRIASPRLTSPTGSALAAISRAAGLEVSVEGAETATRFTSEASFLPLALGASSTRGISVLRGWTSTGEMMEQSDCVSTTGAAEFVTGCRAADPGVLGRVRA